MIDANDPNSRPALKRGSQSYLLLLFLTVAIGFAQQDLSYARKGTDNYNIAADDVISAVTEGSLAHHLALLSLAVVATVSLIRNRANRSLHTNGLLGWSLITFSVWALISPIWAENVSLTVTRTGVFCILCIAAVAVAFRFSIRQFVLWTFFSTLLFVLGGVLAEVSFGIFRPFESGYRFAGGLHPNGQGIQCGLLLLSAIAAANLERRWRALLWSCALLGLVFLVLSGSRTAFGSTVLALGGYLAATCSRKAKLLLTCALGLLFCCLLLFVGPGLGGVSRFGRVEDTGSYDSLNGRTLVWIDVGDYVRQHPLLGYGYGGFWTANHIADISEREKWGVAASHSAYIDCMLALGIVGLVLYVILLIAGVRRAFGLYRLTKNPGFAFGGALVLYFTLDGFLDSVILGVSLLMFVCMVILAQLAFLDRYGRRSEG